MKNKLLYLFITFVLASCSTYNYQTNQDIAIYELKTEPKEALFTERKYTKGSRTLEFYIHDLDDSTFQFKNIQIYDSTLAGELEATKSDIVRDSLIRKNIYLKNEVHINIDRRCTNKNTRIYLEPIDIIELQSYKVSDELRDSNKKQVKKILTIYLLVNLFVALFILIIGAIIFS